MTGYENAYERELLQDADLDQVAHFYERTADEAAQFYLGAPEGPDGGIELRRAA